VALGILFLLVISVYESGATDSLGDFPVESMALVLIGGACISDDLMTARGAGLRVSVDYIEVLSGPG
jgi:hypothetical protein